MANHQGKLIFVTKETKSIMQIGEPSAEGMTSMSESKINAPLWHFVLQFSRAIGELR